MKKSTTEKLEKVEKPEIPNLSKTKQVGRYGKKSPPPKEGSATEAPVQAALDLYAELKELRSFRIPDNIWTWIHNPKSKVPVYVKKMFSEALAGWPDKIVFIPLTDKYLLACPIEAKSRTGTWSSKKQKLMGEEMNYQIPRSADQAIAVLNNFIKDAEKIKKIIEGVEDGSK
jgi:hypothetical protein